MARARFPLLLFLVILAASTCAANLVTHTLTRHQLQLPPLSLTSHNLVAAASQGANRPRGSLRQRFPGESPHPRCNQPASPAILNRIPEDRDRSRSPGQPRLNPLAPRRQGDSASTEEEGSEAHQQPNTNSAMSGDEQSSRLQADAAAMMELIAQMAPAKPAAELLQMQQQHQQNSPQPQPQQPTPTPPVDPHATPNPGYDLLSPHPIQPEEVRTPPTKGATSHPQP